MQEIIDAFEILEKSTANDFINLISEQGEERLIIDLLRQQGQYFDNRNEVWFMSEFKGFMQRLKIAGQRGTPIKDRLQQEIDEWADLLDDDYKSRLYVLGNESIQTGFVMLSGNNPDENIMSLVNEMEIDDTNDDGEDLILLQEELINLKNRVSTPDGLMSFIERVAEKTEHLSQEEIERMNFSQKVQFFNSFIGFSESSIKIIRTFLKEIVQVHYEMEYYQKLIDYQYEFSKDEIPIESENGKKILVALPKVERSPNDRITSLTSEQTTYLFSLLRESRIILNEKNYQPASNIALSIKLMTGYNDQNIRAKLDKYDKIDKYDIRVVLEKIEKINSLINRHLK